MSRLRLVLPLCFALLIPALACTSGGGSEAEASGSETGTTGEAPPEPVATVAELLVPFDVNRQDLEGPGVWATRYGKTPELITVPDGSGGLAVLAADYTNPEQPGAWLLHLEPSADDFVITAALEPPMLDRIMGLALDSEGQPFVASGVDEAEAITTAYPAPGEYRSGIVRVASLSWTGTVGIDVDLDLARQAFGDEPELLINPMTFASSRMAYGAGTIALLHSINTNPDDAEVRHQKAISTHIAAATGEVTKTSSIWVSHSFDQRIWHDGQGFIEAHLGDAYPRHIAFARIAPDSGEYPLFHIKGPTGDNVTRSLLGDVAPIVDDPTYGYIALFVSERSPELADLDPDHVSIAGARELGIVRIRRDFETIVDEAKNALEHLDPGLPDTLSVDSGGTNRTNRLRWLTNYEAEGGGTLHAERPKLLAIGGDRYIVLWERWETGGGTSTFAGTQGMVIDSFGELVAGPAAVSAGHLPRGDDAFVLDGKAGWLTGDMVERSLRLYLVDDQLEVRKITIE